MIIHGTNYIQVSIVYRHVVAALTTASQKEKEAKEQNNDSHNAEVVKEMQNEKREEKQL